ncbi:inactive tyrosine-protein kinase transmembrane receptor ROR1-like isoform X3 [Apostichopus japonicus]
MNNVTADVGDTVTLTCRIRGFPIPNYWWYRNDAFIQGNVGRMSVKNFTWGSRLKIRNVDTLDMGAFKCISENTVGSKTVTGKVSLNPDPISRESFSDYQLSSPSPQCERYHGTLCRDYFEDSNVYVDGERDQDTIESELEESVSRIQTMDNVSPACLRNIIPSICLTAFPLCQEIPNVVTHRLCQDDCTALETDICSELYEYVDSNADELGEVLPVCTDLPAPGTEGENSCLPILDQTDSSFSRFNLPNREYIILERQMNNATKLQSGDKAVLHCRITGYPTVEYKWFKNEVEMTPDRMDKRTSTKTFDWGSRLLIRHVDPIDTGYYLCKGSNSAGERSTSGIIFAKFRASVPTGDNAIPSEEGMCLNYLGSTCANFLKNNTIYMTSLLAQGELEKQLTTAFLAIVDNLTQECQNYAIPSLCFFAFPQCDKLPNGVPQRRQLCRDECEILEMDICKTEYERAKLHPRVILPDCSYLPVAGSRASENCMRVDIPTVEKITDDTCYKDIGQSYRGKVNKTIGGYDCQPWDKQEPHEHSLLVSTYHELAGGHNYCRNPGGGLLKPWCFTMNPEERVQQCEMVQCANPEPETGSGDVMYFILPALALVVLVCIPCVCLILCWRQSHRDNFSQSGAKRQSELVNLKPNNKARDFPLAAVKFEEVLGEGTFGKVYRGQLMGCEHQYSISPVTIKTLEEKALPSVQQDFKSESDVMATLRHPNIILLLGVCLKQKPFCMFFEFMPHGDLHEYLVRHSPNSDIGFGSGDEDTLASLDHADFLTISVQVASGMEYLSSRHFVHRDLAARNCMVGDNLQIKIADFGLSRDIYAGDYYRMPSTAVLPIRWMSPEAILFGRFSIESDIWAFGVVLWEIYSFGLQPFYGYKNQEVIDMIRTRHILPCPNGCLAHVYALMMECWHEIPARRPPFKVILARLQALESMPSHIPNGHNSYPSSSPNSQFLAQFGPMDDASTLIHDTKPGIMPLSQIQQNGNHLCPSERSASSQSSGLRKSEQMEQTQV